MPLHSRKLAADMVEQSGFVSAGVEHLYYRRWGNGKKVLLAFHGYGDTSELFLPLAELLSEEYTILAFDLPHHGGSKWDKESMLGVEQLSGIVNEVSRQFNVTKLSLIGYSLGGRICLALVEREPALVDKVILVAPDGLRKDRYYYFFTQTNWGKKMFRNMLEKPQPYFRLMRVLRKLGLVHHKRYKFAMHFLLSEDSRNFLLRVWPSVSGIMPEPAQLKKNIRQHRLPLVIFMGVNDKIMPPSIARKFKAGLDSVQLQILERGHRIIDAETAPQIAQSLL